MPAAAAAPFAEAALAESFAAAAPEMFATSFIPEAAMGAEFGTAAAFDALGAGALGAGALGLEGLGMAGLEGISAAAPSLGEAVTQGIISGGGGAGTAGINEAMLAQQQFDAVQAANSGMSDIVSNQMSGQGLGNVPSVQTTSSVAPHPSMGIDRFPIQSAANVNPGGLSEMMSVEPLPFDPNYAGGPVPIYDFKGINSVQAGSAIDKPYIMSNPSLGTTPVPGNAPMPGAMTGASAPTPTSFTDALSSGFQKALDFAKENPLSAASMGYSAMKLLGDKQSQPEKEEYNGILTKYKMSPDFKGRIARPEDYQYTPKVYTNAAEGGIMQAYAGGGPIEAMSNANAVGANTGYPMADISKGAYATPYQQPISRNVVYGASDTGVNPMTGEMRFSAGGKTTEELAMDYYKRLTQKPEAPSDKSDVGIYYDLDPDTRYLDPLTAAQIRMAKVNKRANMQLPGMKRPTPMGQINLAPPGMKAQDSGPVTEAAGGGIMSLGGYAAGGNPRLLKGPGDGMSDNIPATIAGKQPARLADGEFVVPADVVSHLGNGSTDAGAKKLHQMMTNVRKARTGNPKQGKQINPNKYMPK
jgi:hypothetical protein